jgi:hypothetical protein
MSAVSYLHKLANVPDPTRLFVVKKMLQGAKKLSAKPDVRLPITVDILRQSILAVDATSESSYQRSLLKAMYLLAYFAFLRVGEFTTDPGSISTHVLMKQDVELQSTSLGTSILVTMHHYKHSMGRHANLRIMPQPDIICPVSALRTYYDVRGNVPGPLFILSDGLPVTRSYFATNFNIALQWANLDSRYYKGHSLRIGAATTAAAMGMTDVQIQVMGRWRSNAFKRYIRIPTISLT